MLGSRASALGEADNVVLELPDLGLQIDRWKDYTVDSNFLTASDQWSFTLGDDDTNLDAINRLEVGQRVSMRVNGATQLAGYIDDVTIRGSRGGGTEVQVTGRDLLGPIVDGNLDPDLRFKPGQTVGDVLTRIFEGYGLPNVVIDNDDNVAVLTGQTRALKVSKTSKTKRGKTRGGKPLVRELAHLLKPYPAEGAFAFAARVAQKHGLWLWLSAVPGTVIAGTPNFDQAPSYVLRRLRGPAGRDNNILEGSVTKSASEQPSAIICTGAGGGGLQDYSPLRVVVVNGLIKPNVDAITARYGPRVLTTQNLVATVDATQFPKNFVFLPFDGPPSQQVTSGKYPVDTRLGPYALRGRDDLTFTRTQTREEIDRHEFSVTQVFETLRTKYPGATFICVNADHPIKYEVPWARPLYLQDDTANTLERLQFFGLREMALRQRKAFTASYRVQGHTGFDDAGNEAVFAVDTMVTVHDEVTGLDESLYVLGRTFHKSRDGGTFTDLMLVKPRTIAIS